MSKLFIYSILIVLLFSLLAMAQVTLNRTDIPDSIGYTPTYITSSNQPVTLGATGGSQRWDFSTVPTGSTLRSSTYVSPDSTLWHSTTNWGTTSSPKYAQMAQFVTSFAGMNTPTYMYYRYPSGNTSLEMIGVGLMGDSDFPQQIVKPTNTFRKYVIPLTYNLTWRDSLKGTVDTRDSAGYDLKAKVTMYFQNSIDAYGTVVYPGDSAQCLRLTTICTGTYQVGFFYLGSIWVPVLTSSIPAYTTVSWITPGAGVLVSAVSDTGITTANFTTAKTLQVTNRSDLPRIPSNLSIALNGTDANLAWSRVDSTVAGFPITISGYHVYSLTEFPGSTNLIGTITNPNTVNFIDGSTIPSNLARYYTIRAVK